MCCNFTDFFFLHKNFNLNTFSVFSIFLKKINVHLLQMFYFVAFLLKLKDWTDLALIPSKCGSSVLTPDVISPDYKAFKQLAGSQILYLSADCQSVDTNLKVEFYDVVSAKFCHVLLIFSRRLWQLMFSVMRDQCSIH